MPSHSQTTSLSILLLIYLCMFFSQFFLSAKNLLWLHLLSRSRYTHVTCGLHIIYKLLKTTQIYTYIYKTMHMVSQRSTSSRMTGRASSANQSHKHQLTPSHPLSWHSQWHLPPIAAKVQQPLPSNTMALTGELVVLRTVLTVGSGLLWTSLQ